jgi:hypothetical protein
MFNIEKKSFEGPMQFNLAVAEVSLLLRVLFSMNRNYLRK